jgi:hypothetical protein
MFKEIKSLNRFPHVLMALKTDQIVSISRIYGSHSGSYERCHLLGYSAVQSVYEPTFLRNVSLPSSGSKISRGRNQSAAGG